MNVQTLIDNGRLKSVTYDNGKLEIVEKVAPQYRIMFEAVDKRLLKQKKAAKVVCIDKTVPQDMLPVVYEEIMFALHKLVKEQETTK